jgi:hypothetical protein
VYATLTDVAKPELLVFDISKFDKSEVTVIYPLAGDRLAPNKEYVFSGDVVLTTVLPKDSVVGLIERNGLLVGVALASMLNSLSFPELSTAVTWK